MIYHFRWFFGWVRRAEAEKLLMMEGNCHGSFLVRESESRYDEYSLSIREREYPHLFVTIGLIPSSSIKVIMSAITRLTKTQRLAMSVSLKSCTLNLFLT